MESPTFPELTHPDWRWRRRAFGILLFLWIGLVLGEIWYFDQVMKPTDSPWRTLAVAYGPMLGLGLVSWGLYWWARRLDLSCSTREESLV